MKTVKLHVLQARSCIVQTSGSPATSEVFFGFLVFTKHFLERLLSVMHHGNEEFINGHLHSSPSG